MLGIMSHNLEAFKQGLEMLTRSHAHCVEETADIFPLIRGSHTLSQMDLNTHTQPYFTHYGIKLHALYTCSNGSKFCVHVTKNDD